MYQPTWTYDPTVRTGPFGQVNILRRLMADTDFSRIGLGIPVSQRTALFSDQEYMAFLADEGGDVTFAWSKVLLAIATNRAIMSVYVNLGGGGDVDFRQIADQLMKLSQQIIDRYSNIPAEGYAEIDSSPFAAGRIMENTIMREWS